MTPTIDNSNLPKFPPFSPTTQWMARAICGKQRKPYCSSVATRAPPIKSHPDRIGHLPSLCLSTTKKMLFIIWRIENTWGEIEKFCNILLLRPMFAPFNIHTNPNLLLYSFTLQDTFHLEFFLIYDQLFIPQSWYEELKILVETSKSFALCLVYTKIHIYFYNSAQMILQLGNRIVTFYFLAATRRWMTFSILHCARRLPSSIFPHLRPIVHSPLHVP